LSACATASAYSSTPTSISLPQLQRRLWQDDRALPRTLTIVIARFLAVAATTSAPAPVLLQQQQSTHGFQRRGGTEQFLLQFPHVTSSSTRQHASASAQDSRTQLQQKQLLRQCGGSVTASFSSFTAPAAALGSIPAYRDKFAATAAASTPETAAHQKHCKEPGCTKLSNPGISKSS
jgi:hypothetical protein